MAAAVTAGCRVTGLVTPTINPSRSVWEAARHSPAKGSAARFCVSPKLMPSKPSDSAASPQAIAVPGTCTDANHTSSIRPPPPRPRHDRGRCVLSQSL